MGGDDGDCKGELSLLADVHSGDEDDGLQDLSVLDLLLYQLFYNVLTLGHVTTSTVENPPPRLGF